MKLPWLKPKKPIQVAVIGDFIVDEYLEGDVHRISPEAPVPVHNVKSSRIVPGGAANVALNVQKLGGQVSAFGVVGADASGDYLHLALADEGVTTSGLMRAKDITTIRKTRVSSGKQQLLRIDWEKIEPIAKAQQDQLVAALKEAAIDVILVSDYGKGGLPDSYLRRVIEFALKEGIPIAVDPKGNDYDRYAGATLITPNRKEALWALSLDNASEIGREPLAQQLHSRYAINHVLLTLGAEGMLLLETTKGRGEGAQHYLPAEKREVYDVSGAGDTVIAVMALVLGSGSPLAEGMYFANVAAGLECEKWGTYPISQAELLAELQKGLGKGLGERRGGSAGKIFGIDGFLTERQRLKDEGKTLVFTNGCFDLLHSGHVDYLEQARSLGDALIVAVNTDASISRLKGPTRPLQELVHRQRVLAGLAAIDYLVAFDQDTPLEVIEAVMPDILVKGADYTVDQIVGSKEVIAAGGEVHTITLTEGQSTSSIVAKIEQAYEQSRST